MRNFRRCTTTLLVAAALVFLTLGILRELDTPGRALRAEPSREAELARELEGLFSSVAEDVNRCVVSIETIEAGSGVSSFPQDRGSEADSIGSGFIIDERGFIITNHHLVGAAGKIVVRLHDGRETGARVIQSDQASDLALIKIETAGLHAMPLGDSDAVRVGQWVLAIGNPFGLTQTVSAGIVSAVKRSDLRILPFESFIQTDASINPGNSGGPLVNLRGEAIGINTAIYTGAGGGNQGIGFAVPIQLAKTLVKRWMDGKGASFLGILPARVDADMARYYGLAEARGAFVSRVDADGPGGKAGVQVKDLIVAFGKEDVRDENHLRVLIAGANPGEVVELVVLRGKNRQTIQVTPVERESPAILQAAPSGEDEAPRTRLLGITVTPVTQRVAAQLGIVRAAGGVVVLEVQPGSTAQKKGISPADIIVEVNDRQVTTIEDLTKALELSTDVAMIRIERGNGELGYMFLTR